MFKYLIFFFHDDLIIIYEDYEKRPSQKSMLIVMKYELELIHFYMKHPNVIDNDYSFPGNHWLVFYLSIKLILVSNKDN